VLLRFIVYAALTLAVAGCETSSPTHPTSDVPPAQIVPATAPPHAELAIRFDSGGADFAVMGLTPITFDASKSTGDGLSYAIDYGDGEKTTSPTSVHVSNQGGYQNSGGGTGILTAHLSVVDRFGRTDGTDKDFAVFGLKSSFDWWWNSFFNTGMNRGEYRELVFERHVGHQVSGFYRHPENYNSRFTGSLDTQGIHLKLDDGTILFDGPASFPPQTCYLCWQMALKVRGGSADGQTLVFHYYYGY